MKKSGLLVALLLVSVSRLCAQVTAEVVLDQDLFLPGEDVRAAVRIVNRSGQTLHLGDDSNWLKFSIDGGNSFVISKTGEVPVKGAFNLGSSERAIKHVNLAPYFDLSKPGHYTIVATVNIKQWNTQITSTPATFDVIEGVKLWEQEVGIPQIPGDAGQRPKVRKYTLQQANYLKQLMLYLQVTDGTGKIYKVFPIGPMLSFGQPEPQIDEFSNLHILYQNGPHSFSYSVISPEGDILIRQTYEYTTRPRMKLDDQGLIHIVGGQRQLSSTDIPPDKPVETSEKNP